jgi:ribosomal protein L3
MAGQYGNTKVTARNLRVVKIDPENSLILVQGAVPGPNGGIVSIRATNRKRSKYLREKQEQTPSAAKKAAAAKKKK